MPVPKYKSVKAQEALRKRKESAAQNAEKYLAKRDSIAQANRSKLAAKKSTAQSNLAKRDSTRQANSAKYLKIRKERSQKD